MSIYNVLFNFKMNNHPINSLVLTNHIKKTCEVENKKSHLKIKNLYLK